MKLQTERLQIEESQAEALDIQRKLQANNQTDWWLTKNLQTVLWSRPAHSRPRPKPNIF